VKKKAPQKGSKKEKNKKGVDDRIRRRPSVSEGTKRPRGKKEISGWGARAGSSGGHKKRSRKGSPLGNNVQSLNQQKESLLFGEKRGPGPALKAPSPGEKNDKTARLEW